MRRLASSTIAACSSSRPYPKSSGLRNGGRSAVRLPPARSRRGSTTNTASARDRRSRSSFRTFQSSISASRSAMALGSFGNRRCWKTFPPSIRNDPNQVVRRSTSRRRRLTRKSVSAWRLPSLLGGCFPLLRRRGTSQRSESSGLQDPRFRDETGDVLRRGHVERGVARRAFFRCYRLTVEVEHFLRRTLLDRDLLSRRQIEVNRAGRRRDIERNAIFFRDYCLAVGPDLVRGVSVGRDAVCSDEDEVHLAPSEEMARGSVRDDGVLDSFLQEFPGRESGPLQARPRLIGVHH